MPYYCINQVKDEHGDNEVHTLDCAWKPEKRTDLGLHESCESAVTLAKGIGFKSANGCIHCSKACHTS